MLAVAPAICRSTAVYVGCCRSTAKHDVQFPEDTRFRLVEDAGTDLQVLMANRRPSVVLVTVDRGEHAEPMPRPAGSTLPDNVFPVFMERANRSVEVQLTPGVGGEKRSIRLRISQLPFVCATGSTMYKVQGETLTSMVVADWKAVSRPGVRKPNQRQQAYIVVSRVTQRSAFAAMKPLTIQETRWFQPEKSCLDEDDRLTLIANQLLTRPDVQSLVF